MVGGSHERALAPLPVLLFDRTIGGALSGVLIPLRLAFEVVKDRSNHFFARGMAGGDVEEFLGGSWALVSQLVNQGLTGGPRQESSYDVGVGNVGQLIALLGEAPDVLTKSFPILLLAVFEISRVLRTRVGALEVSHENLL